MAGVGASDRSTMPFDSQAMGGLAAHYELAGAGDLKRRSAESFGNLHHRGGVGERLQGSSHNAGALRHQR